MRNYTYLTTDYEYHFEWAKNKCLIEVKMQLDNSLDDLIQDKPSSKLKLLAVWNDLSIETQIKILLILKEKIPDKLKNICLSSKNSYIRHLTARYAQYREDNHEDKKLIEKITEDESPLVKYANFSNYSWFPSDVENIPQFFFSLPHEKRIIILSSNELYWPGFFTKLITWAIEHEAIPQNELDDLTDEFTKNSVLTKYFSRKPYDGYDSYQIDKDFEELWRLVPKLVGTSSAFFMIKHLPTTVYGYECIPDEILRSLNCNYLIHLFGREDVYLSDFRKEVFLSDNDKYDEISRAIAISKNATLDKHEFHALIKDNRKDLLKILYEENTRRPFLRPEFLLALDDLYCSLDLYSSDDDWLSHEEAEDKILKVFNSMDENKKIDSLISISLYNLAVKIVPWPDKKNPKNPENIEFKNGLEFLEGKVIPNDTWGTYISFSKAFHPYNPYVKRLLDEIKEDFNFIYPTYLLSSDEIFSSDNLYQNKLETKEVKIDYLYSSIKKLTEKILKIEKFFLYFIGVLVIYFIFKG